MDLKELKRTSIELMATAQAVYLTTIGPGGYPYTRAMLNLRNREQFLIFDTALCFKRVFFRRGNSFN